MKIVMYDTWDNAAPVAMRCHVCNPEGHDKDLANSVNIWPEYLSWTSKTLHKQQLTAAKAGADLLKPPHNFLTLWGEPGRGKTGVAIAMVNACIRNRVYAWYTSTFDMLESLKNAFGSSDPNEFETRYRFYVNVPVLVLDEYDRGATTDWTRERIGALTRARFDNRENHLTILTTNVDPSTFDSYLWSRLTAKGNVVAKVDGVDLRRL